MRRTLTADRMLDEGQGRRWWRNPFGGMNADDAERLLADTELEKPRSRRLPGDL